jgi:hypothetical protein
MDSTRRASFIAGVLFIITFVTSIPAALVLYTPVLDDPNYIVGAGADAGVALGAFLEVLLIVANVGTAVALFPSSSGRTRRWRSAMSPLVWSNAPSSPSASSACWRS